MATLFTKIIQWDIPSYKIYEDEFVYAFLDIFPQKPGHTLIVPKCEVNHFSEVPEPYYSAIFTAAKHISPAIQDATGCERVCMTILGYEIPHCHCHLIPTEQESDMHFADVPQALNKDLSAMQKRIIENLK